MLEKNLEKIYRILRIAIFATPIFVISVIIYLVLFPIESFQYFANQPENSKFEIERSESRNEISFGVFPTLSHRYVSLKINLGEIENRCLKNPPAITLEKTYRAFLYPDGEPIREKDELKKYLFRNNKSRYPNGSLLHFKPTDEVYLLTDGQKILFPGPEIFRAFGYNFDNLVDVEKSTLDQFPDAENKIFSWFHSHPNETIFQAYPSHKIYLVADGTKREIENLENLDNLWPKYFTIPVSDSEPKNRLTCSPSVEEVKNGKISCRFDRQQLPSPMGGYYNFTLKYSEDCPVTDVHPEKIIISFISEKSFTSVKDSLRKIFASIINRYFLKQ